MGGDPRPVVTGDSGRPQDIHTSPSSPSSSPADRPGIRAALVWRQQDKTGTSSTRPGRFAAASRVEGALGAASSGEVGMGSWPPAVLLEQVPIRSQAGMP